MDFRYSHLSSRVAGEAHARGEGKERSRQVASAVVASPPCRKHVTVLGPLLMATLCTGIPLSLRPLHVNSTNWPENASGRLLPRALRWSRKVAVGTNKSSRVYRDLGPFLFLESVWATSFGLTAGKVVVHRMHIDTSVCKKLLTIF